MPGGVAGEHKIADAVEEISPFSKQVCEALILLGWSQAKLAKVSGILKYQVAKVVRDDGRPIYHTRATIRAALEAAGVEFTNSDAPGVRLRPKASEG